MPPIDPNMSGGGYAGNADAGWRNPQPAADEPMSLLQMAQMALGDGSSDPWASERAKYGSFDLNRNEAQEPNIFGAAEAASSAGTTPAGLMAGFFPRYVSDNVQGYKIPSDKGGFFTAEDLFRHSPRGAVPELGSFMQNRPSTNNWRLLGMGPGWILRNGQLIDTNSTGARWGGSASWMPSGGNSGEQSMPAIGTALGAGAAMGVPNMVQAGLGQPASWGWPGAANWFGGGPMSMQT